MTADGAQTDGAQTDGAQTAGAQTRDKTHYSQETEGLALFAAAQQNLALGQVDVALNQVKNAMAYRPDDPTGPLLEGQCLFAKGDPAGAVKAITALHQMSAPSAQSEAILAAAYGRLGNLSMTIDHCRQSLALEPDQPSGQSLLANAQLRGPHYLYVLQALHQTLKPQRYLEIGIFKGNALGLAPQAKFIAAVDPAPHQDCKFPGNATLFRQESDAFFASLTENAAFDMAFVDGLHEADQVFRDIVNAYRHTRPGGLILVHDICPLHEAVQRPERATSFWTGDVWKGYLAFTGLVPKNKTMTIPAPPSGLGVIAVGSDKAFLDDQDRLETAFHTWHEKAYEAVAPDLQNALQVTLMEKQSMETILSQINALVMD